MPLETAQNDGTVLSQERHNQGCAAEKVAVASSSMKAKWKGQEESTEEDTLEVDRSERQGFGSSIANLVLNLVLLTSLPLQNMTSFGF